MAGPTRQLRMMQHTSLAVFQFAALLWIGAYPLVFLGASHCGHPNVRCAVHYYTYYTGLVAQLAVVPLYTAAFLTPNHWLTKNKQQYSLALLAQWAWWLFTAYTVMRSAPYERTVEGWQITSLHLTATFLVLCAGSLLLHTLVVINHLFDGIAVRPRGGGRSAGACA